VFAGLKVAMSTLPYIAMSTATSVSAAQDQAAVVNAAWLAAQTSNSVSAYSEFILTYPYSEYTDNALCALQSIDEAAAVEVVGDLNSSFIGLADTSISFDTCVTTGAARLVNI